MEAGGAGRLPIVRKGPTAVSARAWSGCALTDVVGDGDAVAAPRPCSAVSWWPDDGANSRSSSRSSSRTASRSHASPRSDCRRAAGGAGPGPGRPGARRGRRSPLPHGEGHPPPAPPRHAGPLVRGAVLRVQRGDARVPVHARRLQPEHGGRRAGGPAAGPARHHELHVRLQRRPGGRAAARQHHLAGAGPEPAGALAAPGGVVPGRVQHVRPGLGLRDVGPAAALRRADGLAALPQLLHPEPHAGPAAQRAGLPARQAHPLRHRPGLHVPHEPGRLQPRGHRGPRAGPRGGAAAAAPPAPAAQAAQAPAAAPPPAPAPGLRLSGPTVVPAAAARGAPRTPLLI